MSQTTVPIRPEHELLRIDPATGSLKTRTYQLSIVAGPDAGRTLPLTGTARVGTHADCEVCLRDETVSRYHVELQSRGDGVRVRDLASTNGTLISGIRIQDAIVEPPVNVRVGKTELRISVNEAEVGLPQGPAAFGGALGTSAAMRRLFGVLQRVAPTDATVLLLGETGTGKEVVARALHAASSRASEPFVVVDCGALSKELIESELFGHVRGAFTGAQTDRRGAFLDAHRGTVFLDEIGELPLEVQPKLLRVLESGAVKRVGDDLFQTIDLRVVAATHRDLQEHVRRGAFREDLYFRLAVVPVIIPPLRERREDVPLLIQHVISQQHRGAFDLPQPLLTGLASYSWPGNVRELRNVVERALAGGDIQLEDGGAGPAPSASELSALPFKEAKERLVSAFTREYLAALLEQCDGNISQVARTAGIARNYVQRLVQKYGIKARS
jgi:two-component system response regulator GlrR